MLTAMDLSAPPVVRLFGAVGISHDGITVSAGGPRQCLVLAVLAATVGRPVSQERLIDAVWIDPPTTVTNTLQVYISGLRKQLRPAGLDIARSGRTYSLQAQMDDVDADRFQRLGAEGRAALRAHDPDRALPLLERAWELWNPTPLAGLDDSAFASSLRASLVAAGLSVAFDLGSALCALRRADEAAGSMERMVETYPFHEPFWELLMRAHYHAGRSADALASFGRARKVFLDELGLDPSPALARLELEILDHCVAPVAGLSLPSEADRSPVNDGASSARLRRVPLPTEGLVGREVEVEQIVRHFGSGARVVTVVGLGGIGKTTAALAAAAQLAAGRHTVAFVDLSGAHDVETAMSSMCDALGIDPGPDPADAVATADPDAVLLADNCEQVAGFPVAVAGLVAATTRMGLMITSRRALQIRAEHLVPIGPLATSATTGPSEAARLFVARVEQRGAGGPSLAGDEAEIVAICQHAGGIPLAIEIAASRIGAVRPAMLLERLRRQGSSLLDQHGPADLPERQQSLATVLGATVGLLEVGAPDLARRIAVANGPLSYDMLELIVSDRPQLLDHLDELVGANLVARPDDAARFRMPVPVMEYLMRSNTDPSADRGALVGAVLRRAESLAGSVDATGRWSEAGLVVDAAAVSAACEQVMAGSAPGLAARLVVALRRYWLVDSRLVEAERCCRAVLTLDLDDLARADVMLVLGQFSAILQRADAAELLESAIDLGERNHGVDRFLLVNSCCYLGSWLCDRGNLDEARRVAIRVEALAGDESGDVADLARDFRSYVANRCGDFATAADLGLEMLATARRRGDRYVLVDVLYRTAESLFELGRVQHATELVEESMEIARTTALGPMAAKVFQMQAALDIESGRLPSATGLVLASLRLTTTDFPDPITQAASLQIGAAAWFEAGEVDLAARCSGAASGLLMRAGSAASVAAPGPTYRRLDRLHSDAHARSLANAAASDPVAVITEILGRSLG